MRAVDLWQSRSPSETICTTSSPPTALSMNKALKRSCSGVEPDVLSSVALSAESCSGLTVTDMMIGYDAQRVLVGKS